MLPTTIQRISNHNPIAQSFIRVVLMDLIYLTGLRIQVGINAVIRSVFA